MSGARQKISAMVEEGNPKNWPRRIARKHPRTLDATSKLLEQTNEVNLRFAVTEFVFEREAMERARIRKELLEWADDLMRRGAYMDSFREALDRICPEEPAGERERKGG